MSLRALAWATRFFWIIALAFAVTCVYSVTLMRVNFGEPTMTQGQDVVYLTLPINFDNGGYYTLTDFNMTTIIVDNRNSQIGVSTSYLNQIPPKEILTFLHNTSFDQSRILGQAQYLFYDSDFTLSVSGQLKYAGLIPFGFKANTTMPWGAPLHNLSVSEPGFDVYNSTHLRLSTSISFQNHSPYFPVVGNLSVEILNGLNQTLGVSDLYPDVQSNEDYSGEVELLVMRDRITPRGQVQLTFQTVLFTYGPMVMNYG
ncbi:MAG: hypothetical protein NWE78_03480 [Candidatus Bathyarchaeota archaeon]|nr:hypothetical protein [Candidatus Bathyarchaeota archaeon]